ncbi:hypothetical protein [Pseudomonas fluorescens]|uniref:hypothetical protein n=1 Tax=Pseudomonas fluorescens TaxID=294 RepID=UPI00372D5233
MSGGGGGQKTSTTQSIPDELKPLAAAYSGKAMQLANTPYQAYNGQQVADLNRYQTSGADMIANRAQNGDALMNQGSSTMQNALASGKAATTNAYAGSNPYLQQNIDAAMGDITKNYNNAIAPGLTTQSVGSGSFGNSGAQAAQQNSLDSLAKNLGNTASSMRMQDYGTQQQLAENYASRNDQMLNNYIGQAPTYGNQAYTDASKLMDAGNMYQDNNQQKLDSAYQSWSDQQNDPYKKLAAMSGVFGSGLGNTSTSKTSGSGGGK